MAFTPEMQEHLIHAQDEFVWEVPAWEHHERSTRWYVLMTLACVIGVGISIYYGNFAFAFIILISAVLILLNAHKEPHTILVQIGHHGIVVDGKMHEYRKLDRFSIIYHPPLTKVLYIDSKTVLIPRLRIELADEDPLEVRRHLKTYLPEDVHLQEEHLSDILGRLLKL